jgi:hypothetical protein
MHKDIHTQLYQWKKKSDLQFFTNYHVNQY